MSRRDGGMDVPDSYWTDIHFKPENGPYFEYASVELKYFANHCGPQECYLCQKTEECFELDAGYIDWHYTIDRQNAKYDEVFEQKHQGFEFMACWRCHASGQILTNQTLMILGSQDKPDLEVVNLDYDQPVQESLLANQFQNILLRCPRLKMTQDAVWLVNAGRPMQYLGIWESEEFSKTAPDGDGYELYKKMDVNQWYEGFFHDCYEDLGPLEGCSAKFYAFQCRQSGRLAGFADID